MPATYIAVTPLFRNRARSREIAQAQPDWAYVEIATCHDAMLLVPDELTALLDSFAKNT